MNGSSILSSGTKNPVASRPYGFDSRYPHHACEVVTKALVITQAYRAGIKERLMAVGKTTDGSGAQWLEASTGI